MAIYIVDKNGLDIAVSYAAMDSNAKVFLIQDGLYAPSELLKDLKVFVFSEEVEERGLGDVLPASFERIGYDEGIDIMVDERIVSFC